jgi:hypothetical protein
MHLPALAFSPGEVLLGSPFWATVYICNIKKKALLTPPLKDELGSPQGWLGFLAYPEPFFLEITEPPN